MVIQYPGVGTGVRRRVHLYRHGAYARMSGGGVHRSRGDGLSPPLGTNTLWGDRGERRSGRSGAGGSHVEGGCGKP